MTKTRTFIIGALVLSLLAFGIVALASNGFGKGAAQDQAGNGSYMQERDSDGDGIINCNDPDWTRPLDGTGYGAMNGGGAHDGAGQGLRHGMGNGAHNGSGQGEGRHGRGMGAGNGTCREVE